MDNKKKECSIEELEKQYAEAKKASETLGAQLKKAQQKEEDRKRAQLTLEKDKRKKEVDKAYETYQKLLNNYVKDYGRYSTVTEISSKDSISDLLNHLWWGF